MSIDRLTRVNELIKRELGQSMYRVIRDCEVDLAAVTVTHVQVSSNLRQAKVYISILGHEHERPAMLHALRAHRVELQQALNEHLTLKYTPRLHFQLDPSIEKGDHLLHVLAELEKDIPPPVDEER